MGMFSENYSGQRCSDCTWADNAEQKMKLPDMNMIFEYISYVTSGKACNNLETINGMLDIFEKSEKYTDWLKTRCV